MEKYQEDEISEVENGYMEDETSEIEDSCQEEEFAEDEYNESDYRENVTLGRIMAVGILVFIGIIILIWLIRPILLTIGSVLTDKVPREDLFMIALFVLMGAIAITIIVRGSKKKK